MASESNVLPRRQITDLCINMLNGFLNKEYNLAVFIDLSKAFDTVHHATLLLKLEKYGIRGSKVIWTKE